MVEIATKYRIGLVIILSLPTLRLNHFVDLNSNIISNKIVFDFPEASDRERTNYINMY